MVCVYGQLTRRPVGTFRQRRRLRMTISPFPPYPRSKMRWENCIHNNLNIAGNSVFDKNKFKLPIWLGRVTTKWFFYDNNQFFLLAGNAPETGSYGGVAAGKFIVLLFLHSPSELKKKLIVMKELKTIKGRKRKKKELEK